MFRKELGKDGKPPRVLAHDGFDERGYPLKEGKCLIGSWETLEVFVGEDPYVSGHAGERADWRECVQRGERS
jgi:hypothetical protein